MKSKHLRKSLGATAALMAAAALMAPSAFADTPAPGYGQFAGCPSPSEQAGIEACFSSVVTGGKFKMGNKDVPITNPITFSGGLTETGEVFFNSKGGLTKAPQKVPGGLVGVTGLDFLTELLTGDALTLFAVTELAGKPSNPLGEPFELPVKIRLVNPVLGNNCYVGSNANPIKLNLITGTTAPPAPNTPITGDPGDTTFTPDEIIHVDNGIFVDNSFASPGATGCTLTLFGFLPVSLDAAVNLASGLPSPAGTNETIQNFNAELVAAVNVYP